MTSYMYYPNYAAPCPGPAVPPRQAFHGHSQSMGAPVGNYGYYPEAQPLQPYYQPQHQQGFHHRYSSSYQMVLPPPGMGFVAPAVPQAPMLPQLQQPSYQPPMPNQQPQYDHGGSQVNGGVRDVLDYDLNFMAEFVVKNAYLIFDNEEALAVEPSSVLNIFNKGVSSVLNATRLPSVTVFMALDFLCKYVAKLPTGIHALGGDSVNIIYQNLMIAFVLANKFNDDKTFTNKSWSHATGMELSVINKFERDWLAVFEWKLFDDNFVLFDEYHKSFEQFCQEKTTPFSYSSYNLSNSSPLPKYGSDLSPSHQNGSGFQTPVQLPSMVYSSPSYTDGRSATSNSFYQQSLASPTSKGTPTSKNGFSSGTSYNYYNAPMQVPPLAPVWGGPTEDLYAPSQFVPPSKAYYCY
ncbi:LADA_0G15324g1_1 [Lachancea dasiensis]|uniref:LADA_0G15324g1_1 n=1 Tax=Lachancea dasiensis TaxID=1072105 RepID=A0A1G4JWA6_9SACH|nr:LADA_0G15324g1_1 [Lachancea dasiensis]